MSLHLGNDFVISSKQIVGLLNLNNLNQLPNFTSLIKQEDKRRGTERIRKIGPGPYRSAILCIKGTLYLSSVDSLTLTRRMRNSNWLLHLLEEPNGKNFPGEE